ncbi:hypothetical protein PsorP6_004451 [Peronosclerospora sorghi]|uniref:Uncharacterized protein n=1 Tax=Peronosclerospora sorghi TaxID=230839 RepID=A0ACC0VS07_9STRA|nr:hypothetical protein PsorP6_004451 [Peronosclerospora sorghi]
METQFGASLRSLLHEPNQSATMENISALCSTSKRSRDAASISFDDHKRAILLQLLKQVTEFLEHKEAKSSRLAVSTEWRKSRSQRRWERHNLFQVVVQVCKDRMTRLKRSTREDSKGMETSSTQPARILVAQAIVQELLVSLLELKTKEKERLVIDEEETLDMMRQVQVHLQKDKELIRKKVFAGAGDSHHLQELQSMLRAEFVEQARSVESSHTMHQLDAAVNSDASLQFAWETIDDQKKEIIRLRAENQELKRLGAESDLSSAFHASFFDDEPTKAINLLRSQLSSQHHKNLEYLQNHIQRLEHALQHAKLSSKTRQDWDGSKSLFDSSRTSQMFSLPSGSAVRTDFTRTQVSRKKCEECHEYCASLFALESEIKYLQTQVSSNEEALLQAERDREHFQRENSALSLTLLSAKQKQEELRQTLLDLTQEKHKLQNLSDSEQRTLERSIRVLKEQLDVVEEQKVHLKRDFDDLSRSYDAEVISKRTLARKFEDLQVVHAKLSQSYTELENQMAKFDEATRRWEALVETKDAALNDMRAQISSMNQDDKAYLVELQQKKNAVTDLNAQLAELRLTFKRTLEEKDRTKSENERLLQILEKSKWKNQRIERGLKELKQGKELPTSLKESKTDALALQTRELDQAREQINSLELHLMSTEAECARLDGKLADMTKTHESELNQHIYEGQCTQEELEAIKQRCLILETQLKSQREIQRKLETLNLENCEHNQHLSTKLAESKTSILSWITECDAIRDDKQQLENNVENLLKERYNLQRCTLKLEAERESSIQEENANVLALQNEISSLTEQYRTIERERRVMDQKNLSLVQLVQTLQARPELQRRAFREMLVTCQRGTERMLCHLSERVTVNLNKVDALEKQFNILKRNITARTSTTSCNIEREEDVSSNEIMCHLSTQAWPQLVMQENDFLSSSHSGFSLSTSQPLWLESIAPSKQMTVVELYDDPAAMISTTLEKDLKQYRWKYFVQCIVASCNRRKKRDLVVQVMELQKGLHLSRRYKLKATAEMRQLSQLYHLSRVVVRRLSTELQQRQQAQYFTKWKHLTMSSTYESKLGTTGRLQSSYAPSTSIAVAQCIHLIRRFCEPAQSHMEAVADQVDDSADLAVYLMEICTQHARWKVAADRRIAEYAEQTHELQSVQRRCAELNDLVGLNQRLIEEMERRCAGQSSIIEAARHFAITYKALTPFARAQVCQSREFLSASKAIIDSLNAVALPQQHHTQALARITLERSKNAQERFKDARIELLEDRVGWLKGAMHQQCDRQVALRTKKQVVVLMSKKLHKYKRHLMLLRIFWN